MIEMQYVDSSNIEAVGYDEGAMELHVQFIGGNLYVYENVPQEVFEMLLIAPSAGSYLNREVKNIYTFRMQ